MMIFYALALSLLVAWQIIGVGRWGAKGLLLATATNLLFVLGGGTLFWIVWDAQASPPSYPAERDESGLAFAFIWQVVPCVVILLTSSVLAVSRGLTAPNRFNA